jgi:hypothetical protein
MNSKSLCCKIIGLDISVYEFVCVFFVDRIYDVSTSLYARSTYWSLSVSYWENLKEIQGKDL